MTSRRQFLAGTLGMMACRRVTPPPLQGEILRPERIRRGHSLRGDPPSPSQKGGRLDVAVIGGGVAGLSCLWKLQKQGFKGDVALFELGDQLGGTAQSGTNAVGAFALGAHYITLPNQEATHMREILKDLGVIVGQDSEGRPRFDPTMLCLAPQERLHVAGQWISGLWPGPLQTPQDQAQREAFDALVVHYQNLVGADGRPAFAIPLASSSRDPTIRTLAQQPFSAWLDAQGLDSPLLRWALDYAARDDYGADCTSISAWAGLHYHAARRPWMAHEPDLGTHVLTWPQGNGFLVDGLAARNPWPVHLGAVVRAVDPASGRFVVDQGGQVSEWVAEHLVLAVPGRVADRLVPRPTPPPPLAPWRIGVLTCDQPPKSLGIPVAWDSVPFDSPSLGYISSAHQRGAYRGPTVLTAYEPLPPESRASLMNPSWGAEADRVMSQLAPLHPDLRERVQRLDILHWGHGTSVPRVGTHVGDALSKRAEPVGRVSFAHTDLSGMSLFEEASFHGIRAAEEVLMRRL